MKKMLILVSIFLIAAVLLSACAAPSTPTPTTTMVQPTTAAATPTSGPMTFTDGLGRTVTLKAPAQRIVSMAPSLTETLFAIGAGSQVVGRDTFSNYPAEVSSITDIGGSSGNYSYEKIVSLKPDLVLAAEINTADQVKALENLGLTVFYVSNPTDFKGLFDEMTQLGKMTGHEKETQKLVDSLNQRVTKVEQTVAKATTKPVVLYELDGTDPSKPWTAGPGSFVDYLISEAGGKNVASDLKGSWVQISIEDLLTKNPDLILLGDSNYGTTVQQVAARTGWDKLTAVKDGKIYSLDDDTISRAGPRMVDGLEAMAKLIHPELFK